MMPACQLVADPSRLDVDEAARLIAAQQVRGHLLNPNMRAQANVEALADRVATSFAHSNRALAVFSDDGRLRAFAAMRDYRRSLEDLDAFFSGREGALTLEFAVPAPTEADAEDVVGAFAAGFAKIEAPFVVVVAPVAATWCEPALTSAGFVASGVESVRQPYVVIRNSILLPAGVNLREATDDDMDAIVSLMQEEWRFLTSFHPIAKERWTESVGAIALRSSLSQALFDHDVRLIVAVVDGELAGVVSLRHFKVVDDTNPLPAGVHVLIEDISVRASLQGIGLGRALVQATYDAFRDSKIAGYSVAYVADNPIARRLWPHLGFRTHRRTYVRKA